MTEFGHDPHATLGAHPAEGGVVVRTFRPDAERVTARVDGDGSSPHIPPQW